MQWSDPTVSARCKEEIGPAGLRNGLRVYHRPLCRRGIEELEAHGDGCYWFHDRDAGCPARCPVPSGTGTICLETGGLLPAGPCAADCGYRPVAGRWRRCCPS